MREECIKEEPEDEEEVEAEAEQDEPASPKAMDVDQEEDDDVHDPTAAASDAARPAPCEHCPLIWRCRLVQDPCRAWTDPRGAWTKSKTLWTKCSLNSCYLFKRSLKSKNLVHKGHLAI